MRFEFSALPWELLGPRPAMITLTYPGDWRLYVPNSRVLVAHREAFKERWRKEFGAPIGVWVVEFQRRGAPHLHLYVGLPDTVSDEDYTGLQSRTMRRKRREHDVGPYEARRRTPPVSGEFGEWLRTAWSEIAGSGLPAHEKRGVDVAVAFFSERAEGDTDRVKVAEYFWRESGKWAQKDSPEEFGSLKFYGRWGGGKLGFEPVVSVQVLNEKVGIEMRRMLRGLMFAKMREAARRTGRRVTRRTGRSRGRDGLTVFGVDGTRLGPRMWACAEKNALDKAGKVGVDRVVPYPRGPALRAASEIEAVTDAEDDLEPPWEDEPPGTGAFDHEWDLEAEVEAHLERQARREAEIDDAVDREAARLQRINHVRIAKGLAPKRDPKRLRIALRKPTGRERQAR
jgi:hypothetical protein